MTWSNIDIAYITALTKVEYNSEFDSTTDTLYILP